MTLVQLVQRARSQGQRAQLVRQAQLARKVFKVKPARLALKARRVQLVQRAQWQVQQAQLARQALLARKAFKAKLV